MKTRRHPLYRTILSFPVHAHLFHGFPLAMRVAGLLASIAMTSCSSFPSAGPGRPTVLAGESRGRIASGSAAASSAGMSYVVVPITPAVARFLSKARLAPSFSQTTLTTREAQVRVGVGDVVDISIFEAEGGGLFSSISSTSGNHTQLQSQQVDGNGMISVPFGGLILAAGRTPLNIQTAINDSLSKRALEPQSVVTVTSRRSNQIAILGEVTQPLQFPIDPGGTRLFSAIARAGGSKFPSYESRVVLKRDGHSEQVMLSDLLDDPSSDIQLQSADVVYIKHEPRYFTSFGATGQSQSLAPINRRFAFDGSHLSLADALGEAGGLADNQADARSVFLFRSESRELLASIGVSLPGSGDDYIPTVYVFDMKDPIGVFLSNAVQMENHDEIFVANADSVEFNKVMNSLLPFTQAASNVSAWR